MKKPEAQLQKNVCQYLKTQYPDAIFMSECSGLRVSMGVAMQLKGLRSGRALPDIFIAEARKGYHGLFIELKTESPYLKTGELKAQKVKKYKKVGGVNVCIETTDHLKEQEEMITKLLSKGYMATWGVGFLDTKIIIDNYMRP